MGGAAGFVEGLQGGLTHRREAKRSKKLDRLLDVRGEQEEMDLWAQQDDAKRAGAEEGWDMDFSSFETDQDPYDMNIKGFFGRLGNAIGIENDWGKEKKAGPVKTRMAGWSGPEANGEGGARTFAMPGEDLQGGGEYFGEQNDFIGRADGGAVRHMLKKYADGGGVQRRRAGRYVDPETGVEFVDGVPQGEVPTQGYSGRGALSAPQKIRGIAEDVGRNIMGNTRRRVSEWAPEGMESSRAIIDTEGAANKGRAVRRDMAEGARGIGQLGLGILEDTSVLPILKGVGGFLGFGTDEEEAEAEAPGRDSAPSDQAAAIDASDLHGPPAPDAKEISAQPAPKTASAPPQEQAIPAAGGPDGDIDWSKQRVIDPGQMPTHSTQDWIAYRASSVSNMIMRGASPDEAHQRVTAMQQRGFLNHGQQALMLLAAGDAPRATMALKAAYQYFPNGVDVKFGITQGKDGQPALIAMGQLEGSEDGESTGKPMLLTQERLAAMLNNMSDPAAFTNWTKDWRDEQFKREKHRDDTAINTANAETNRILARASENRSNASLITARRGGDKPLTQADYDRGYAAIEKMLAEHDIRADEAIPAEDMAYLSQVAALVYESNPGNSTVTLRRILALYDEGGKEAVDADLRRR